MYIWIVRTSSRTAHVAAPTAEGAIEGARLRFGETFAKHVVRSVTVVEDLYLDAVNAEAADGKANEFLLYGVVGEAD